MRRIPYRKTLSLEIATIAEEYDKGCPCLVNAVVFLRKRNDKEQFVQNGVVCWFTRVVTDDDEWRLAFQSMQEWAAKQWKRVTKQHQLLFSANIQPLRQSDN